MNFKCPPAVLDAFDSVCSAYGVSRTERLVTLMTAFAAQKLEGHIHHLDGSVCPLAAASIEITKVMRSTIMTLSELAKRGKLTEVE